MKYIDNRINANIVKLEDENNNYMSKDVEGALEEIDSKIKTIEGNGYDDTQIKQDINNIKNEIGSTALNTDAINIKDAINKVNSKIEINKTNVEGTLEEVNARINTIEANGYDDTQLRQSINNIKTELGTEELTTTDKTIKGAVNEVNSKIKNELNADKVNIKDTNNNYTSENVEGALEEINSQIKEIATNKMDKNSLIGMSNLSQEVKESMTGGSVAVVGKGAVFDENISESSFVKAVTNNFLEQGLFSDDGKVLYDNTYTGVSNNYNDGVTGNGIAFGFTYNYDYDKLIISGLKADNDSTLIIGITTKDRLTGWATEFESKCIYIKKIPITANEQLNIEVDISEMNSLLTKGQHYMMGFCSILDVESPTYNSNNPIYFKKITGKGSLVNETPIEDIKFILNYGDYAWNSIASDSNPLEYIPAISLRRLPTSYKCYIENYVKRKILEVTKPYTKNILNFIPNDIPLIIDDAVQIFYDSIFNVKNVGNYNLKVENALNDFFERKATIMATSSTVDTVTKLSLVDDFNNEVSSVDLNFKVYPVKNPTTQKNLLIIGDSLTEFGESGACETVSTLYEKLQEKGITNINFIGTKSGRNANAKNEGRAGLRSWDYMDINRQDNPFVQDGAINFKKYCEVNNFNGIDYCIIHMNWNAFGYGENEMWKTLKELADKVLESYPNCKIFIVGMSAYSKYKYSGYWYCTKETVWNIDRKYQEECNKLDNFRYVSLLPYRDMDYGNNYREVNANLRNSNQKERQLADHVHCGNVGYQQIADVYFRELVRQINLDS